MALHFLIIDGYSKASRDEFDAANVSHAWKLYAQLLQRHLPEATYDVLLPSDDGTKMPGGSGLESYAGILWTGCNLTIFDYKNKSVINQIELAQKAYEIGIPSFGSCWALQIAAVAAGGECAPNPKGREMFVARKIYLTREGASHPLYQGKPFAFNGFISHDDIVTKLPPEAIVLASSRFTPIQALTVTHKKGTFWSVQYHPEYNMYEMARLIIAREQKLIKRGFFKTHEDLVEFANKIEILSKNPDRTDLRWQLGVDDDLLSADVRECEFKNWLNHQILPGK